MQIQLDLLGRKRLSAFWLVRLIGPVACQQQTLSFLLIGLAFGRCQTDVGFSILQTISGPTDCILVLDVRNPSDVMSSTYTKRFSSRSVHLVWLGPTDSLVYEL